MSYWVTLQDERGKALEVEPHSEGGTYALGGTEEASLNVTYNYASCYSSVEVEVEPGDPKPFSLRLLHDIPAGVTIPWLEKVVAELGTERYEGQYWVPYFALGNDSIETMVARARERGQTIREEADPETGEVRYLYDTGGYWKATPGNAGYAASILLAWARQYPQGVWEVN